MRNLQSVIISVNSVSKLSANGVRVESSLTCTTLVVTGMHLVVACSWRCLRNSGAPERRSLTGIGTLVSNTLSNMRRGALSSSIGHTYLNCPLGAGADALAGSKRFRILFYMRTTTHEMSRVSAKGAELWTSSAQSQLLLLDSRVAMGAGGCGLAAEWAGKAHAG
jgi:hypothetical protein